MLAEGLLIYLRAIKIIVRQTNVIKLRLADAPTQKTNLILKKGGVVFFVIFSCTVTVSPVRLVLFQCQQRHALDPGQFHLHMS